MIVDPTCLLFKNIAAKLCCHLFLKCYYSSMVCCSICAKFTVNHQSCNTLEELALSLRTRCDHSKEGNLTVARLCFPALVWIVWKERNHLLFRNSSKPLQCILKNILHQIRLRATFLGLDVSSAIA